MTKDADTAPSSPASGGHADVEASSFIARVERTRAIDRKLGRLLVRAFPWLVAAGIGGALLAIAVPNFIAFNCRAMSSEAKGSLRMLYVAEAAYFGEHARYALDPDDIGWRPDVSRQRYSYYLHADEQRFEAVAVGVGPTLRGDVWRIGTDGAIEQLADGCR